MVLVPSNNSPTGAKTSAVLAGVDAIDTLTALASNPAQRPTSPQPWR